MEILIIYLDFCIDIKGKKEFCIVKHTLIETSTGVFDSSLRDSQPHHCVGALLWGPQAVLHGLMKVWHSIGHRWETHR